MINKMIKGQKGFAMLFTVLLVSLILSIAISISNLTLKQSILSNLVKDSQIAFYQADAAVECGLYQDVVLGLFPLGTQPSDPGTVSSFTCGDYTLEIDTANSYDDYLIYKFSNEDIGTRCLKIIFDKTLTTDNVIQGYGYNICGESPRQVERALELHY